MDFEVQELIAESLALANKLLLLIEEDKKQMRSCVGGEIFDAYSQAAGQAADLVEKMRQSMVILQAQNSKGL